MSKPRTERSFARTVARLAVEFLTLGALLFVARFIAQADLTHHLDEECHVGGIAVDVLAHGVRFPLNTYAPHAYDNGAFFGGLLTAAFFWLFGRNVLVLKLVSHCVVAAGAVATVELLRSCLAELRIATAAPRRTAIVVLALALACAPRVVTVVSTGSMGFGGPAEGSAVGMVVLALSAWRLRQRPRGIALAGATWVLLGVAVYLNKANILLVAPLGIAELATSGWRRGISVVVPAVGLLLGDLPDVLTMLRQTTTGWANVASKVPSNLHAFPWAFLGSVRTFADGRFALIGAWALAVAFGIALVSRWRQARAGRPIAVGIVTGTACLHILVLTVMAHGGIDHYMVYAYPAVVVLLALLAATICDSGTRRWPGLTHATWVGVVAAALALYRPAGSSWDPGVVSRLWNNRAGAACSWRFAETFQVEQRHGSETPEQHAVDRCRTLSDQDQILDCIGGIARRLSLQRSLRPEPPPDLSPAELRAFAFYSGARRFGDATHCADFSDQRLQTDCVGAVQLSCLVYADINTLFFTGHALGRPRCTLPEPPFSGYWAEVRGDYLARPEGVRPHPTRPPLAGNDVDVLGNCEPILRACY